ncbi:hypothetical protein WA026_011501 [Henosepilachna vigintioctopunctata]|uniref:Uncharacterized protein n=1 Tax=Henosepilachna vigintioctopunctata TaxID=420089 RepID=A0AAW1TJN8_9CUCU
MSELTDIIYFVNDDLVMVGSKVSISTVVASLVVASSVYFPPIISLMFFDVDESFMVVIKSSNWVNVIDSSLLTVVRLSVVGFSVRLTGKLKPRGVEAIVTVFSLTKYFSVVVFFCSFGCTIIRTVVLCCSSGSTVLFLTDIFSFFTVVSSPLLIADVTLTSSGSLGKIVVKVVDGDDE